jgi:hypothetical protein
VTDDLSASEDRAVRLALEVAALRATVQRVRELADDWEHQRQCEWACEGEMADDLRSALGGPK